MKRPTSDARAGGLAVAVVWAITSVASYGWAGPPPVDFALEAVGEGADERRDGPWSMTVAEEGPVELCGKRKGEDGAGWRFAGDGGDDVEVVEDADAPWSLVWAVLWASKPGEALSAYRSAWNETTARVEVVGDELVYCWGDDSRLCVDETKQHIQVLEIEIEGVDYGVRTSREAERLQVTVDGSPTARLKAGECGR